MGSGVEPQALLGDIVTGFGSEPVRAALAKYNEHSHQMVSLSNFYSTGIKVGDLIVAVSACDDPIVSEGSEVVVVQEDQIQLNTTALKTIQGATIVIDNLYIYNVNFTHGSPIVTLGESMYGFVKGNQLDNLTVTTLSGVITNVTSTTYPVLFKSPYDGYIRSIHTNSPTGRVSYKLVYLNGVGTVIKELLEDTAVISFRTTTFNSQDDENDSYLPLNTTIAFEIVEYDADSTLSYSIDIVKCIGGR